MGNKYSVVREEADEAEFRRLVEAVEIAQQRAVPRDDIESGINVVLNTRGRHQECSRQPKDHDDWSIDDVDRIDDRDSPIVLPSPRSLRPCIRARAAASTLSSKSRTPSPHLILVVPTPSQITQSHDHDVLIPTSSPPPTLTAIPNDPPRMIHCRMASRLPTVGDMEFCCGGVLEGIALGEDVDEEDVLIHDITVLEREKCETSVLSSRAESFRSQHRSRTSPIRVIHDPQSNCEPAPESLLQYLNPAPIIIVPPPAATPAPTIIVPSSASISKPAGASSKHTSIHRDVQYEHRTFDGPHRRTRSWSPPNPGLMYPAQMGRFCRATPYSSSGSRRSGSRSDRCISPPRGRSRAPRLNSTPSHSHNPSVASRRTYSRRSISSRTHALHSRRAPVASRSPILIPHAVGSKSPSPDRARVIEVCRSPRRRRTVSSRRRTRSPSRLDPRLERLFRNHEDCLAQYAREMRDWRLQNEQMIKIISTLGEKAYRKTLAGSILDGHGDADMKSDADLHDDLLANVQSLAYKKEVKLKPYPNRPYAAGLPLGLQCADDWKPVWTVFPLKAFRGSSYTYLKIKAEWDDSDLLRELSRTYDKLRTVWRKWFSLKSVRSITMVLADHSVIYPRRVGPAGVSPSKNMRLRWFLHHPGEMKGRREFMQVLTARTDLGIEFVERWQLLRIAVAILLPVFLSVVLAVLYSAFTDDVSSAFTIAGYMTSAYSVCLVLVGLLNFVEL